MTPQEVQQKLRSSILTIRPEEVRELLGLDFTPRSLLFPTRDYRPCHILPIVSLEQAIGPTVILGYDPYDCIWPVDGKPWLIGVR